MNTTTPALPSLPTESSQRPPLATLLDVQQRHLQHLKRRTASERLQVLNRLQEAFLDHRSDLQDGLFADMGKSATDTDLSEILTLLAEFKDVRKHLKRWMRPQGVPNTLIQFGTRSYVQYEPKGAALIISPWNYPILLSLGPLVSALAAGCSAILKPSEFTPHTNAVLRKIIESVFPPHEVGFVEGGVETAQELLSLPFNHIFFTGSPAVGKIVMRAAADHLASVTLELGGKSPTIIDDTANIEAAARKIAWGKCTNGGQTCIAPDHVYVHHNRYEAFLEAYIDAVRTMYGANPDARKASDAYPRMIHERHFDRMASFLTDARAHGGRIPLGGEVEAGSRYVDPAVVTDAEREAEVMQDEIFGPILPVYPYDDLDEVLEEIRSRPKPLTLYLFSTSRQTMDRVLSGTSAGTTCINDTLIHFANTNMPFGGVNTSGIGKSHGFAGFQAFSNARGVTEQKWNRPLFQLIYPPYGQRSKRIIDLLIAYLKR